MKFNPPLPVSWNRFIQTGKWDVVSIGDCKSWILSNFADPDGVDENPTVTHATIWTYSNVEFHFSARGLSSNLAMIFCDNFADFGIGPDLRFEPGWFQSDLTLLNACRILNREGIDFQKTSQNLAPQVRLKVTSGVELCFTHTDTDPNEARLAAFSLR